MKKKSTIIISTILALSTLFAAGCSQGGTGGGDGLGGGKNEQVRYTYDDAVHVFNATDLAGEYLVKDGATDYVIVYPDQDSKVAVALQEFQTLFKKATGIDIIAVNDSSDNAVLSDSNAKRISLGETTVFKSLSADEQAALYNIDKTELGRDGVRIATKDNTVYILGGTNKGVLYGVYDFMQICFNYEFYYRNCIQIDTGVKNLPLKDFDVIDIPDAEYRRYSTSISLYTDCWGFELENGVTKYDAERAMDRYREVNNETYLPIYKEYGNTNGYLTWGFHSISTFVYPGCTDETGKVIWRPEWDSGKSWESQGVEICYTAHGNKEAYDALVEACADKVIYTLKMDTWKDRSVFGLTHLDGGVNCRCSSCLELEANDGGAAVGAMIRFANDVMEQVEMWKQTKEAEDAGQTNREVSCYIFAYGNFEKPPVKTDSKGKTVPVNDEVVCRDDVGIFLCMPTTNKTIYRQDGNADFTERFPYVEQWKACAKTMYNWLYISRFQNYSTYRDDFNTSGGDYYAFLLSNGSQLLMNQTDWEAENMTSFNLLKEYMLSKLMWDCSLDMNELCTNFFNAMYKDAADTMFEVFTAMRVQSFTIAKNDGTLYGDALDPKHYPYKSYIEPLINKLEKALTEIEDLKITNAQEYELVRKRIETEMVGPLYLALRFCKSDMSDATYLHYKQTLIEITSVMYFKIFETSLGSSMYDFAINC